MTIYDTEPKWWQSGGIDISLAEDENGKTWVHRIDCLKVQDAREKGYSILTIMGCKGAPDNLPRCECVEKN